MNQVRNRRGKDKARVPARPHIDVGTDQGWIEVELVRDICRQFDQFGL